MTTSENMNVNDGEIIALKRDVALLLKMDSYQDMTDEEISSIIEWEKSISYEDGYNDALKSDTKAKSDELQQAYVRTVQEQSEVLQSLYSSVVHLFDADPEDVS